jgi:hypothetical protein
LGGGGGGGETVCTGYYRSWLALDRFVGTVPEG